MFLLVEDRVIPSAKHWSIFRKVFVLFPQSCHTIAIFNQKAQLRPGNTLS